MSAPPEKETAAPVKKAAGSDEEAKQVGIGAPVSQVILSDDALIRRTMPAAIIASLEADAARALVARPEMAVTAVNRQVGWGRTTLVVLYSGYENPADNGLCVITLLGGEHAVAESVRRTLLELLAGPEGRGEGRKGAS